MTPIVKNLTKPKAAIKLSPIQQKLVEYIKERISSESWTMRNLTCLCRGTDFETVANTDRFGNDLNTVICKECGTLRCDPYYSEAAIEEFYTDFYRDLYRKKNESLDGFFDEQMETGKKILRFCHNKIPERANVLEVGCGAGGILQAFMDQGHVITGLDFGKEYLNYGVSRGLNLINGSIEKLGGDKFDLIILNHVLEHIPEPVKFIRELSAHLSAQGKIFIGLPGVYYIPLDYDNNIHYYLQNAHCWHFTLKSAEYLMNLAGLEMINGDEEILSIFQPNPQIQARMPKDYNKIKTFIQRVDRKYIEDLSLMKSLKHAYKSMSHE